MLLFSRSDSSRHEPLSAPVVSRPWASSPLLPMATDG